jgi:hypothetical protein
MRILGDSVEFSCDTISDALVQLAELIGRKLGELDLVRQ